MTLNIALLGRQPKYFLNFSLFRVPFLLFIFSDIGFLVFSIIDVSFWLFSVKTRKRRYWGGSVHAVHYKSRKSHLQVGRVSWPRDHQCAQIFTDPEPSLSRRDVESQRRDVSTSRHPFYPLCNVATWIFNVATSILSVSVTSRCGFLYSLERRDVSNQRRDVNFY